MQHPKKYVVFVAFIKVSEKTNVSLLSSGYAYNKLRLLRNPKALMFEIQGARHMFSPEAKISCRRMSGVYQEFWVEKNGS